MSEISTRSKQLFVSPICNKKLEEETFGVQDVNAPAFLRKYVKSSFLLIVNVHAMQFFCIVLCIAESISSLLL